MHTLITVSVHSHPSMSHIHGLRRTPAGCHLIESKAHKHRHTLMHAHTRRLPPVAVASVLQSPNSARCKCVVHALWHSGGGGSTGSENEAILKSTGAAAAQPGKVVSAFTACF